MIEKEENKEYLPIQGLDAFRKATVDLLLGAGNPAIAEVRRPCRALALSLRRAHESLALSHRLHWVD
jgi:aspartate/tyrosine/aromatic aminotransferase